MTLTIATPHAIGRPGYTALLPCQPKSVRRARAFVSSVLATWGIGDLVDDGEVVVSELLTNALDHTTCPMARVVIEQCSDGVIRIEVADSSHAQPQVQKDDVATESGRGLLLVAALSWRWGCDEHDWGKSTWAELKVLAKASSANDLSSDLGERSMTMPIRCPGVHP
ncbi:ATP-binding protein [Streptomyces sp. NPDC085946]|uniref:ATP-binding protein n=1 Tax=Streptomyces sp. NPDC085946 TaxID=3365744 RepID=UPI0037D5697A